MAFKHIKRPEEIPPMPSAEKVFPGEQDNAFRDEGNGHYSYLVPMRTIQTEPESLWRQEVYEVARSTGYTGTLHEFFCRDVKESQYHSNASVRFSWYVMPRPTDEEFFANEELRKWVWHEGAKKDPTWSREYYEGLRKKVNSNVR